MATYTTKPTVVINALQWTGDTDGMNTFLLSVTQNIDVRWSFTMDTDHTEMMIKAHVRPDGTETQEQYVLDNEYVVVDDIDIHAVDQATFEATYQAAP